MWYNTGVKTPRLPVLVVAALAAALVHADVPGVSPGPGVRYATDAYPGFDNEKEIVSPSKKEPKWFSWINGPNRDNPADQLEYCIGLIREESYSKAAKHLDALVREWPSSPEAPKAQEALAELLLDRIADYEEAFVEFRYLLDFYSLQCDYAAIADKAYKVANLMRAEGKTIMFFRFANTVDVRRAFESCVLRAPGASWAPQAMLAIGELREEEGKYVEAVKVYENLRNIHTGTPEAKQALRHEADVRMQVLKDHEYNRARCLDTVRFLKLAVAECADEDRDAVRKNLADASAMLEDEAFAAAKFYDSRTRTKRSAISAYERFVAEYPESQHVEEAKRRLEELKGGEE